MQIDTQAWAHHYANMARHVMKSRSANDCGLRLVAPRLFSLILSETIVDDTFVYNYFVCIINHMRNNAGGNMLANFAYYQTILEDEVGLLEAGKFSERMRSWRDWYEAEPEFSFLHFKNGVSWPALFVARNGIVEEE